MFSKPIAAAASPMAVDVKSIPVSAFLSGMKVMFEMFVNAIKNQELNHLQRFLKNPRKNLINPTDDNNILHIAFEFGSAATIQLILNTLDPQLLRKLLCMINHEKKLPSKLLDANALLSSNEQLEIIRKIIELRPYPKLKKLGEAVDEKEIMPELGNYPGIKEIIKAMNETRNSITSSPTHPDVMLADEKQRANISKKYNEAYDDTMNEAAGFDGNFEKLLDIFNSKTIKSKMGTCSDFSHLMLDKLRKLGIRCEIFETDEDHIFLVINRDPECLDDDNVEAWGDALICDPWAGKIYAANKIRENLCDFSRIHYNDNQDFYLIVYPMNFKYQKIKPFYSAKNFPEAHEPPAKKHKPNSYKAPQKFEACRP